MESNAAHFHDKWKYQFPAYFSLLSCHIFKNTTHNGAGQTPIVKLCLIMNYGLAFTAAFYCGESTLSCCTLTKFWMIIIFVWLEFVNRQVWDSRTCILWWACFPYTPPENRQFWNLSFMSEATHVKTNGRSIFNCVWNTLPFSHKNMINICLLVLSWCFWTLVIYLSFSWCIFIQEDPQKTMTHTCHLRLLIQQKTMPKTSLVWFCWRNIISTIHYAPFFWMNESRSIYSKTRDNLITATAYICIFSILGFCHPTQAAGNVPKHKRPRFIYPPQI